MKTKKPAVIELTDTQKVFLMSKVNGAEYNGEALPHHRRIWPAQTWLQSRINKIRKDNSNGPAKDDLRA